MKKNAVLILSGFLLMTTIISKAQVYDISNYLKMPDVAPSSPDVASFEKFGNVPVDYSTGVPNITIPIWNIKCDDISWPIALSYHAGGIKVDETASSVGLGWALTGPGVISRSVIGKPDESCCEPDYENITSSNWDYLYQVVNGDRDSEMDLYSYSFNGKSGKFLITQDSNIFLKPYSNIKITKTAGGFTVLDEAGVKYTFDKTETVSSNTHGTVTNYISSWYLTKVETADRSQVIDFVFAAVGYSYQTFYNFSQSIGSRYVPGPTCGVAPSLSESYNTPIINQTTNQTTSWQLSQINFPNGYIALTYVNDRPDISGTATGRLSNISIYQQTNGPLLRKFTFTQSDFFYRPPNVASDNVTQHRLRLDGVTEVAGDNSSTKPYTFEYNTTPMMPRGSFGQDKWGFNNGQYNNQSLLQSESVVFLSHTYAIGNADRTVDTLKMKSGVLTAINWPTGGRTEYTFDAHQAYGPMIMTDVGFSAYATTTTQTTTTTFIYPASNVSNPRLKVNISNFNFPGPSQRPAVQLKDLTTGNVRYFIPNLEASTPLQTDNSLLLAYGHSYEIKAMIYTNVSTSQLHAYIRVEWQENTNVPIIEKGGGLRIRQVKNYTATNVLAGSEIYQYNVGTQLTPFKYININYNEIKYSLGVPDCYGLGGCQAWQSNTCRIYHSGSVYGASTVSGSPLMYSSVTKNVVNAAGLDNGASVYEYDIIQDNTIAVGGPALFSVPLITNEWKNGFLKKESHYKRTGTTYELRQTSENEYLETKNDVTNSLKVYPKFVFGGSCGNQSQANVNNDISYFPFPIYTGSKKLYKTTTTTTDDYGSQIATTTYYEYTNPTNDLVTKSITTNSKHEDKSITLKYPSDFSASGNVYEKMVLQNIIAPVIEQKTYKEIIPTPLLLTTVKNNYRDWKNDSKVLAPELVQAALLDNPLENRLQYYDYDAFKNVTSVGKISDVAESYIFDYKNAYPIAEVKNANLSDIAYTSFEADGKGNWNNYTGTITTPSLLLYPPTGDKYYNLTSTSPLSKTVISGRVYVISYWSKSGAYNITGGTGSSKTGRTINGWVYYEHKISTSSTTLTISPFSGTGLIDEVRLYPDGAEITTYTYSPLIGISSKCDMNNRIIYYQYDGFGRLTLIRDQDKNIIKRFDYQYKEIQ